MEATMKSWVNRNNELYIRVKDIVNKYDPINLLKCGAPEDEYEPEVIDILNRCHFLRKEIILEEVEQIFIHWFTLPLYNEKTLKKMCNELFETFNKNLEEQAL
jgi:hypothetical protein